MLVGSNVACALIWLAWLLVVNSNPLPQELLPGFSGMSSVPEPHVEGYESLT